MDFSETALSFYFDGGIEKPFGLDLGLCYQSRNIAYS
jgi:hypothetical protein